MQRKRDPSAGSRPAPGGRSGRGPARPRAGAGRARCRRRHRGRTSPPLSRRSKQRGQVLVRDPSACKCRSTNMAPTLTFGMHLAGDGGCLQNGTMRAQGEDLVERWTEDRKRWCSAAGKGTPMKSERAKVLARAGGRPIAFFPIVRHWALDASPVVVVVGLPGGEREGRARAAVRRRPHPVRLAGGAAGDGQAVLCARKRCAVSMGASSSSPRTSRCCARRRWQKLVAARQGAMSRCSLAGPATRRGTAHPASARRVGSEDRGGKGRLAGGAEDRRGERQRLSRGCEVLVLGAFAARTEQCARRVLSHRQSSPGAARSRSRRRRPKWPASTIGRSSPGARHSCGNGATRSS